jgi:hypothetical protein
MDRIWQWAWDRYGARYTWAIYAIAFPVALPIYLVLSFVVVAFEKSGHYVEAAAVTVDALVRRSPGLIDRGSHVVKGKSAAVQVFGLEGGTHLSI